MAALSDPGRNAMFARRWTGPPPSQTRKRPEPLHKPQPSIRNQNLNHFDIAISEAASQRACRAAVRRLRAIERRTEVLEAIGLTDAALRLAAVAESIRAVLS
jgi:hypothetical protein